MARNSAAACGSFRVDSPRAEAAGDPLQRLRVHIGILFEGQTEDLQHPERPVAKHQIGVEIDSSGADGERAERLTRAEIRCPGKSPLAKIGFHRGADDAGQVADVARRQVIALHETLDIAHAAACRESHQRRNRHLRVEIEPLLRPSGPKMKVAADRPQEALCRREPARLAFAQNPFSTMSMMLSAR